MTRSGENPRPKSDGNTAREAVVAMRAAQAAEERRRKIVIFGATGVISAAIIAAVTWAVIDNAGRVPDPGELPSAITDGREEPPPWDAPDDPTATARRAGLDVEPMGTLADHFHAHLDIIVDGEAVPVPANIGIPSSGPAMSELHTHDESGVLHVEAPTADKRYTLGQVFAQWDVRLDATGIGSLENDSNSSLRAYVDGERHRGDPADIELTERRQIALIYGPKDAEDDPPASYPFDDGQ